MAPTAPVEEIPEPASSPGKTEESSAAPSSLLAMRTDETPASLERSLTWRSQILFKRVAIEDRGGDGRALVEFLLLGADEVIRQLPQAAQKALSVSRDTGSSINDLVRLFERDPTLTQTLLKRANSLWYRRGNDVVTSIGQAVQRIGMKGVENIFLENIARGLLCRPGKAYNARVVQVWDHLQNTAVWARGLAPVFRVDPDTAHAIALLHDIGKLVIFDRISEMRGSLRREVEIAAPFLDRILLHMHEPLAGQAALTWGMGGELAYAVAHHHRYPVPDSYEPLTELVYVADRLDHVDPSMGLPDWEAIWEEGTLLTPREEVEARFAEIGDFTRPDPADRATAA